MTSLSSGLGVDAKGYCVAHPAIKLRRRARSGEWQALLPSCPLCVAPTGPLWKTSGGSVATDTTAASSVSSGSAAVAVTPLSIRDVLAPSREAAVPSVPASSRAAAARAALSSGGSAVIGDGSDGVESRGESEIRPIIGARTGERDGGGRGEGSLLMSPRLQTMLSRARSRSRVREGGEGPVTGGISSSRSSSSFRARNMQVIRGDGKGEEGGEDAGGRSRARSRSIVRGQESQESSSRVRARGHSAATQEEQTSSLDYRRYLISEHSGGESHSEPTVGGARGLSSSPSSRPYKPESATNKMTGDRRVSGGGYDGEAIAMRRARSKSRVRGPEQGGRYGRSESGTGSRQADAGSVLRELERRRSQGGHSGESRPDAHKDTLLHIPEGEGGWQDMSSLTLRSAGPALPPRSTEDAANPCSSSDPGGRAGVSVSSRRSRRSSDSDGTPAMVAARRYLREHCSLPSHPERDDDEGDGRARRRTDPGLKRREDCRQGEDPRRPSRRGPYVAQESKDGDASFSYPRSGYPRSTSRPVGVQRH